MMRISVADDFTKFQEQGIFQKANFQEKSLGKKSYIHNI